jgi:hypothetical protein
MVTSASASRKGPGQGETANAASDKYNRKLQRVLRSSEIRTPHLSGAVGHVEPRMTEQMKQSMLSPKLVNPASVPEDDSPLFQCTQCDMIVKESDPYCPFCGAIFADAEPQFEEVQEVQIETPWIDKPRVEKPATREPVIRPEKFDVFSIFGTKTRSRDMLYHEALRGFAGSARLLEEIERLVSDVSSLGTDTTKARRLIGNAWEAARDGDWSLVSTLAHQTEDMMAPSIPDLVRAEIAKARQILLSAKVSGVDISPYVLQIKTAMKCLRADNPDEALRMTKELTDHLREDSIAWR